MQNVQDEGEVYYVKVNADTLCRIDQISIDDLLSVYGYFFNELGLVCKRKMGGKEASLTISCEAILSFYMDGTILLQSRESAELITRLKIFGSAILAYWPENELSTHANMQ